MVLDWPILDLKIEVYSRLIIDHLASISTYHRSATEATSNNQIIIHLFYFSIKKLSPPSLTSNWKEDQNERCTLNFFWWKKREEEEKECLTVSGFDTDNYRRLFCWWEKFWCERAEKNGKIEKCNVHWSKSKTSIYCLVLALQN